jgi:hypothetical protein
LTIVASTALMNIAHDTTSRPSHRLDGSHSERSPSNAWMKACGRSMPY